MSSWVDRLQEFRSCRSSGVQEQPTGFAREESTERLALGASCCCREVQEYGSEGFSSSNSTRTGCSRILQLLNSRTPELLFFYGS
jgi:hypothetical protein